ncbi:MAG: hypothetical protein HN350_11870 [Phycisphaerales bacterium]|nr:hypothetical protein [Phycisphaerales bacterium]
MNRAFLIILVVCCFSVPLLGGAVEFGGKNLTVTIGSAGQLAGVKSPGRTARGRAGGSLFTVTMLENVYGLDDGKRTTIELKYVSQTGGLITLGPAKGKAPSFSFKTIDKGRYFTLELVSMKNPSNSHAVVLTMQRIDGVNWMPLDGVTSKSRRLGDCPSFFGVMRRSKSNPLGAIAMWKPKNDADDDETLYQVWANEPIPHPKVKGPWTVDRAKKWVADWTKKYKHYSKMYIGPRGPEDLKPLADRAAAWGLSDVYMHLNSWGDRYWASDRDNFEVNKKIFPGGRADMIAFSKYLRSKGVGLTFRTTSYALGGKHPKYLGARPDSRLAAWWGGRLTGDVDAKSDRIIVESDKKQFTQYDANRRWSDIYRRNCMQIGDELIQFSDYADNGDGTWTLNRCRRGLYNTLPAHHRKGAKATGLYRIYGIAFAPDPDSTLLDELASRFAEFHNDVQSDNCNFDALEVHSMLTAYGGDKFMGSVYSRLDHPVWSDTSGGDQNWGFIEKKFHSVQKALGLRRPRGIPYRANLMIGLHRSHWSASGPYAYCYGIVPNAVAGLNILEVQDQTGFHDVTLEVLSKHGLAGSYAQAIGQWTKYGRQLPAPLKKRIMSSWCRNPFSSRYSLVDELFRFEDQGGELTVVPFRMMKRKSGDRGWTYHQEHGTVYPYQYVRPGRMLNLNNPYHPQAPEFIVRVMSDFNRDLRSIRMKGSVESKGAREFNDMLDKFQGASGVNIEERPADSLVGEKISYRIMPDPQKVRKKGVTTFASEKNGVRVTCRNDGAKVLHHVESKSDSLPQYSVKTDITGAGGLGIVLIGDGSDAILVVRISGQGTRDYIVPLDFKGKRYVEIPTPQASWAHSRWPFFNAYKRWRGNTITKISLGLDGVAPRTVASVLIEDIRFLPETNSALVNPTIKIGAGDIRIKGTISSGQYVWYRGGKSAGVYDLNWNKLRDLPVTINSAQSPTGYSDIKFINHNKQSDPWLEVQFFVKDKGVQPFDQRT